MQLRERTKLLGESGVHSSDQDLPIPLADAFVILAQEEGRYERHLHEMEQIDRQSAEASQRSKV